ncbi:MAG: Hint domain-containing protein [Pseudomonadota bacterium]
MAKVLDFEFDEAKGATTADSSVGKTSAAFRGDATPDGEGSVWFDGDRDYVEIAPDPGFGLDQGTVQLDFTQFAASPGDRPFSNPGAHTLFSVDSTGRDGGGHLTIFIDSGGQVVVRHQDASSDTWISGGNVLVGDPTSVAYSWGPDGGKLLVNGKEVASHKNTLTLAGDVEPIILGASQTGSGDGVANNITGSFDGEISRFTLFNQPMTQSGQIPCFGTGTLIATPTGCRRVEDLQRGDRIALFDGGTEAIREVFHTHIPASTMAACPSHWPVLIPRGRLGAESDLFLSRQHCVRVSNGTETRLVRAGQLARLGPRGVRLARGKRRFSYVHLLCDGHFVINANGVPCETLLPGPRISQWTGTLATTAPCHSYASGDWCRAVFAKTRETGLIPA